MSNMMYWEDSRIYGAKPLVEGKTFPAFSLETTTMAPRILFVFTSADKTLTGAQTVSRQLSLWMFVYQRYVSIRDFGFPKLRIRTMF
jgi:hypothetical protein